MDESPEAPGSVGRRRFLRVTGATALVPAAAALLSACVSDGDPAPAVAAAATTKKSGALRKVKLGIIALTDCAPSAMAKELGFYAQRGLDVTIEKQSSWPATRDNLLTGGIDGAHCLNWMPYSVASGVSGSSRDLKVAMMLNSNGQAITLGNDLAVAGYGDLEAAKEVLADETQGKVIPIPPPQMIANMKINTMDAFCVGEPGNAVAVAQDIGFTHLTTQDLWLHHPEKALVVNAKLAADQEVLHQLILGTLEAGKWLDDLDNRRRRGRRSVRPAT